MRSSLPAGWPGSSAARSCFGSQLPGRGARVVAIQNVQLDRLHAGVAKTVQYRPEQQRGHATPPESSRDPQVLQVAFASRRVGLPGYPISPTSSAPARMTCHSPRENCSRYCCSALLPLPGGGQCRGVCVARPLPHMRRMRWKRWRSLLPASRAKPRAMATATSAHISHFIPCPLVGRFTSLHGLGVVCDLTGR